MAGLQEARAVSPSGRGRDEEMADPKQASLTVLGGPLAGSQTELPSDGIVTIGAAADCTFPLGTPSVSPLHARVVLEGGRATVHATGSPLHVNDNPLEGESGELHNGDILWLGAPGEEDVVMLQVILPPIPEPAEAPPPSPSAPTPEVETQALWTTEDEPGPDSDELLPRAPTLDSFVGEETVAYEPQGSPAEPTPSSEADASSEDPLVLAFNDKDEGGEAVHSEDEEEGVLVDEGAFASPEPDTPAAPAAERTDASPPEPPAAGEAPGASFHEESAFIDEAEPGPTLVTGPEEGQAAPLAEPEAPTEEAPFVVEADAPVAAPEVSPGEPEPPSAEPMTPPAEAEAPIVEPEPPAVEPEVPTAEPIVETPAGAEPAPTASPASDEAPAPPPSRPAPPAAPPSPDASPPPRPRPRDRSARGPGASMQRGRAASLRKGPKPASRPAGRGGGSPSPALMAIAGFVGVLLIAGGGLAVWRFVLSKPSPAPTPVPVAASTPVPPPVPSATPAAVPAPDTPVAAVPQPTPTPLPVTTPTPEAAAPAQPTPTPRPTPTPTPTPAPVAPEPARPSAAELQARQDAARVQQLLGLADAAMTSRQYDAAVGHLDEALRLEPGNTRATTTRARAVALRDLARRRFVTGRTRVETAKAGGGGLAGFDTGGADVRQAPDFQGRIEFEMTPPAGIAPGDPWSMRIFVVNDGQKAIDVQGVSALTRINGSGSESALSAQASRVRPQQRVLVAETSGTWADGTDTWTSRVTVTARQGDSLSATLSWK